MEIKIIGNTKKTNELFDIVQHSLEELGLSDFIKLEKDNSIELKKELNIKEDPALVIIEESIDFKDMIFEGIIPEEEEIKSMLVSIIGGDMGDSCAPSSCSSCGSASICGI